MKLTDSECKVLWAAQHQANASTLKLSKITGLRPHVVRHALYSLKERGIIHPIAVLDASMLQIACYDIYFSINISNI